jgi:diguanylate cyclase (GGDEF)-like protein
VNDKPHLESFDSRQLESLRVFHEVASALTTSLDLDALLRAIMKQMEDFFGPEQWSLLLLEEETREMVYALTAGGDDHAMENVRLPRGEGIAGYVAETGNPLVVPSVSADPDWSRYAAAHPELNLHSIACLPIRHGERTLAVLSLHNAKLDLLPDSAISFLRVLCDYAAIALHNAAQVKLIHDLSITDDCTGLFNARYLYTMIEEEIAIAHSHSPRARVVSIQAHQAVPFSLLFFDLDHFKSVNDTHGHLVGSRLLSEIGGVIKRTLGPEHVGFRYGGDEFVALLRGLDKASATLLAQRLRQELNETLFLTANGLKLSISASFGLATFPEDGDTLHSIIRSADSMMYVAKDRGRDCIAVADPTHQQAMPHPKTSRHTEGEQ